MKLDFGEIGEIEVAINFYSLYVYEQEFNSSLLGDVFGVIKFSNDGEVDSGNELDLRKTNWVAITKALWACVKSANDKTPRYASWAKQVHGLNILQIAADFIPEIKAEFFR